MSHTSRNCFDSDQQLDRVISPFIEHNFNKYVSSDENGILKELNKNAMIDKLAQIVIELPFIDVDHKCLLKLTDPKGVRNQTSEQALARLLRKKLGALGKDDIEHKKRRFMRTCRDYVHKQTMESVKPLAKEILQQNNFLLNFKSDASKQMKHEAKQCQRKKRKRDNYWTQPEKVVPKSVSNAYLSKSVSYTDQARKASLEERKKKISEYLFGSEESDQAVESEETGQANVDESIVNNSNTENQTSELVEFTKIVSGLTSPCSYLTTSIDEVQSDCEAFESSDIDMDSVVDNMMLDDKENYCTEDEDIPDEEGDNDQLVDQIDKEEESELNLFNSPCPQHCAHVTVHNKKQLDDHLFMLHKVRHACLKPDCDKRFFERQHLDRHVRQKHWNVKQWTCLECDKVFSTHKQLSNHKWFYHFKGSFGCPFEGCQVVYNYRHELSLHKHEIHKNHTCLHPNCGKSFAEPHQLLKHLQIHVDLKPFYCAIKGCGKMFKYEENVVKHIRMIHLTDMQNELEAPNITYGQEWNQFIGQDVELLEQFKKQLYQLFYDYTKDFELGMKIEGKLLSKLQATSQDSEMMECAPHDHALSSCSIQHLAQLQAT